MEEQFLWVSFWIEGVSLWRLVLTGYISTLSPTANFEHTTLKFYMQVEMVAGLTKLVLYDQIRG